MGVEVRGTFDVQRFWETMAMLLSKREGINITVKVTKLPKQESDQPEMKQTVTVKKLPEQKKAV